MYEKRGHLRLEQVGFRHAAGRFPERLFVLHERHAHMADAVGPKCTAGRDEHLGFFEQCPRKRAVVLAELCRDLRPHKHGSRRRVNVPAKLPKQRD